MPLGKMRQATPARRFRTGSVAAILAGTLAAGYGPLTMTASATPARRHPSRAALSSVTIRMGDQEKTVQTLLETSGELRNLPFHISWNDFPSGAAGVAALTGGSLDVVPLADAPAIFAYAAHDPVKVVEASLPSTKKQSIYGLLVPAGSSIHSIADLAGKKVGWATGSVIQYFALQALRRAKVQPQSVTFVNLNVSNALAALSSGKVDAVFSADPFLSIGQADFHDKVVASGAPYVKGETFWLAGDAALAKPAVSEALGLLIGRFAKAQRWAETHRSEWAATFAKITGLPLPVAQLYVNRSQYQTVPITAGAIIKPLQSEADFFYKQKVLPSPLKISGLFDQRYNNNL